MKIGKRICILTPAHYLARMGGAEYQIKLITEGLCRNKENAIFYLCRRAVPGYSHPDYHIIKIGSDTSNTRGMARFGFFFDTFNVYKALKQIKPDVIYQRIGCAYTGIAAYYAKKNDVKLIWHISSDKDIKSPLKTFHKKMAGDAIDRLFLRYGIRNADLIIAQTHHQKRLLEVEHDRRCHKVIYNGHPIPQGRLKKKKKTLVLWVGNIRPAKQPDIFIKLAEKIGQHRDISFEMIGRMNSGNWHEQITGAMAKTKNLKYVGELSHEEVTNKFRDGHILVNTSHFEGFPNTFIEAWMCRVPVISLNIDPDHILEREKIGFLSKTFDRLCEDLLFLIQHADIREKMGMDAYHYANAYHSAEKMVNSVVETFE